MPEPEHEVQPGELPADVAREPGEGKSLPDQAFPLVRVVYQQVLATSVIMGSKSNGKADATAFV